MDLEIVGRKLGMTQIFNEAGDRVPVTVLQAGPCTVVQKKTNEKDGYTAVQLGFEDRKEKHATKALLGHFKGSGVDPKRVLFEVRVNEEQLGEFELGQQIDCAHFQEGQKVDLTGTSKGRGFTGVIKRWNFRTSKKTHGTHEFFRHGGALSAGTYPGRVHPGKKMAGQYGSERVTTRGLKVEKVDAEKNLIFVRGSVPGHRHGLVHIRTAVASS